MTDATQKCPVCATILPARAKFCGECGTAIRSAAPAGAPPATRATNASIMPWFLAGCGALAIHAAVIIVAMKSRAPIAQAAVPSADAEGPAVPSGGTPGAAPDISNLTPRQAADRLYERIMRASESGDTGQVQFFAPMALNAYGRVSPMDADARLHLGLIELALGDAASARAQADSITRSSGLHLFGPMLKARAADAAGDRATAREAYRAFLANYDAEMKKNLPEYQQHATLLAQTRTAAQSAGSR